MKAKSMIMKQVLTLTLCIIALSVTVSAQDRIPVELNKTQLKLSILNPNIMFEVKVSENQSFNFSLGLATSYAQVQNTNDSYMYLHPAIRGSFRHYYARKEVKKQLRANSGNFIELVAGYVFDSIAGNDDYISSASSSFFFGPAWGIQRNYETGFLFGLGLGLGYGNGKNSDGYVASTGHITLGFVLK